MPLKNRPEECQKTTQLNKMTLAGNYKGKEISAPGGIKKIGDFLLLARHGDLVVTSSKDQKKSNVLALSLAKEDRGGKNTHRGMGARPSRKRRIFWPLS